MYSKNQLTSRQREILDFIIQQQTVCGYPPTIQEISDHFGFKSLTTVADHLKALERKEVITRTSGARSITLRNKFDHEKLYPFAEEGILVPVIGKVHAGTPVLAVENIEDYYLVDKKIARYGDVFILKVKGNSMIDAHIENGDLILVRPQPTADINDIVVAIIDDEATVKRFTSDGDNIILKPENKSMKPIIYPKKSSYVRIIGKVVGIFRKY